MLKNIKTLFRANKEYIFTIFKKGKLFILSQVVLIVLGVPMNFLQLYAPKYFIEEILNGVVPVKAIRWIILLVLGQLLFVAISNINNIIREYCCANAKLVVKEKTYKHFLSLYLSYFDNSEKLNCIQRAVSYGENGGTSFFMFLISIITSVTSFATLTYISLSFEWWIWVVILCVFLIKVFIGNSIKKSVYVFQKDKVIRDRKISYYSGVLSNKGILPDIKVFNLTDFFLNKHKSVYIENINLQTRQNLKISSLTILEQLPDKILDVFVYAIIGIRLYKLEATVGDYTLFFSMVTQINSLLNNFKGIINSVAEHSLAAQNYLDFMEDNTETLPPQDEKVKIKSIDKISFKNVSFKYSNQPSYTLKNINVEILKGKRIGVVGLNGAGKSTFIKLLLHLYKFEKGSIKINNIDIEKVAVDSFYQRIGVVFQNHNTYSLTLRENIEFDNCSDDNDIWNALEKVGLKSKFEKYPEGLQIPITHNFFNNGIDLSGGEKQKLAIARLFHKDCDLYILDEPSSALDAKSENELYNLLYSMPNDRTIIFISHRLADMKLADEIIVLNEGEIVGVGPHSDLIVNCQEYKNLYELQTKAYLE